MFSILTVCSPIALSVMYCVWCLLFIVDWCCTLLYFSCIPHSCSFLYPRPFPHCFPCSIAVFGIYRHSFVGAGPVQTASVWISVKVDVRRMLSLWRGKEGNTTLLKFQNVLALFFCLANEIARQVCSLFTLEVTKAKVSLENSCYTLVLCFN